MQATTRATVHPGAGDSLSSARVAPGNDLPAMLVNRISWGAVLAGVVLMLAAHVILNMIGAGLGAASIDPRASDNPSVATFSLTAGLWWSVAGLIASFFGALVAGRLSGVGRASIGGLHGLTAWALTLLVMVWLIGSAASSATSGAFGALSGAVSGMGRTVAAAAPGLAQVSDPFAEIERRVRSSGNDPAALRDGAVAAIRAALTGDQAQAAQARERAAEALARAEGVPVEEARARVAQYEQQYRQTVERAREAAVRAADATARTVSVATLFASLALLLGAVAAWFGGRAGVTARFGSAADERAATADARA